MHNVLIPLNIDNSCMFAFFFISDTCIRNNIHTYLRQCSLHVMNIMNMWLHICAMFIHIVTFFVTFTMSQEQNIFIHQYAVITPRHNSHTRYTRLCKYNHHRAGMKIWLHKHSHIWLMPHSNMLTFPGWPCVKSDCRTFFGDSR